MQRIHHLRRRPPRGHSNQDVVQFGINQPLDGVAFKRSYFLFLLDTLASFARLA